MAKELKIGTAEEREALAEQALTDEDIVDALAQEIAGSSRIRRQKAAATVALTDMLMQLVAFAEGNISLTTSSALAQRMKFDSENASGTLRMRSEQIVAAHKKRLEREK